MTDVEKPHSCDEIQRAPHGWPTVTCLFIWNSFSVLWFSIFFNWKRSLEKYKCQLSDELCDFGHLFCILSYYYPVSQVGRFKGRTSRNQSQLRSLGSGIRVVTVNSSAGNFFAPPPRARLVNLSPLRAGQEITQCGEGGRRAGRDGGDCGTRIGRSPYSVKQTEQNKNST